jgi:hypothetical protein
MSATFSICGRLTEPPKAIGNGAVALTVAVPYFASGQKKADFWPIIVNDKGQARGALHARAGWVVHVSGRMGRDPKTGEVTCWADRCDMFSMGRPESGPPESRGADARRREQGREHQASRGRYEPPAYDPRTDYERGYGREPGEDDD